MAKKTRKLAAITAVTFLILTPLSHADLSKYDKTLQFDQPINFKHGLHFDLENPLKPDRNDFKILSTSFMSNNLGERWALITLENTSNSLRLLKNKSIVATFADGKQRYAQNLDETLKGNESISKAVNFGIHQFPIVSIDIGN